MTATQGIRLYLDANILIYMVEASAPLRADIDVLLQALDSELVNPVTSELSIAEVLVKPFANPDQNFVKAYRELLADAPGLLLAPVTRTILESSARLRGTIGGKLADSIHVATAIDTGCTHVLSEDQGMKVPITISPLRLRDLRPLLQRRVSA